jgi:hypothetical protein
MGVPDLEVLLLREPSHRLAISGHGSNEDLAPLLPAEPVLPAGNRKAGGQSFDVPLERAWVSLVEVVDVEHEATFGRLEDAEVAEMCVATQLDVEPRVGRTSQVGRHQERAPAVERERRRHHPAIPDRDQLRNPRRRLGLQELYRVGSPVDQKFALGLARHRLARSPSPSNTLRPRRVKHLVLCHIEPLRLERLPKSRLRAGITRGHA